MNRKALILVVAVFVLGVAVGAMGYYLAEKQVIASPKSQTTAVVDRLTTELGLTSAQQQQVTAILEDTKKNYNGVIDPIRPQLEVVRREGRQKIRAILTPDQLPKFEDHLRRIDEERAKRNAK